MSVKIQPRAGYVVLQQEKAPEKTASGILLAGSAQEKPEAAKVIAVGKDVKDVKIGDMVLFVEEYGKTKTVTMNKQDYTIIKQEHIVATIK
ncbi:MAG: co-chaperone GroES [Candidatus Saccharibacteria bacterium]|nr:co-chaperone GroES [Candidatus Saccharibacteria bacterium]